MLILDTNVISELMKPVVSTVVSDWFASRSREDLYTTTVTQAEILYGIAILPAGVRQQRLQDLGQAMFERDFAGKVLTFDQESAEHYAAISAFRRQQGSPISQLDAQIAAICRTHHAAIVTRNVDDFLNCQIEIINPWDA
jgi:toxin FitB